MVTKSKKQDADKKEQKKGRVKVGKLKLDKETVRDLSSSEARKIKGGGATNTCQGGEGVALGGRPTAAGVNCG
jgi:hypothetical protein